jgi:Na+-transporting NADH:ubiquinone oxidoreductase subunit NqrE
MFKTIISMVVKNLFSENVLKSVFVKVGDFLVSSSKNKLDDKAWAFCKNKLL